MADAGLDPRVKTLDRHGGGIDPHDLARRPVLVAIDADDVAELEKPRQAGDAKSRRPDFGDDAADANRIDPQFRLLNLAQQLLQRPHLNLPPS